MRWVECTHRFEDRKILVNLDQATHIMEEEWGARIYWSCADPEEGGFLDVRENPREIIQRGGM